MLFYKPLYRLFLLLVFITGVLYPLMTYTLQIAIRYVLPLQSDPLNQLAMPQAAHAFQARTSLIDWQSKQPIISQGPSFRRTAFTKPESSGSAELQSPSASGLDPLITEQAALSQVSRVAKQWSLSPSVIQNLIKEQLETDALGKRWLSVPKLNLALEHTARYPNSNNTLD